VTLSTYILMTMLAMGMKLSVSEIVRSFRRTRVILLSVVANIIIVPAVAWVALRIFDDLPTAAVIALVLLASAPGYAPIMAARAHGNLAFSTTLIFLLSAVSVVSIPIVTTLMFSSEAAVDVDGWAILRTLLVFQLAPLVLGMTFRRPKKAAAERMAPKIANVALVLVGVAVLAYGVDVARADGRPLLDLGWQTFVVWIGVTAIALVVGYVGGGSEEASRRTLSLHTAIRNGGLTLLIAATSFPDMGAEIGIIALVVVMYPMAIALALKWARQPSAADGIVE
jgi:BASS family bile acid:Na+ symporter